MSIKRLVWDTLKFQSLEFSTLRVQILIKTQETIPPLGKVVDCASTTIKTLINVVDGNPNSTSNIFRNQTTEMCGMSILAILTVASNNHTSHHIWLWCYEMNKNCRIGNHKIYFTWIELQIGYPSILKHKRVYASLKQLSNILVMHVCVADKFILKALC